MVGLIVFLIFKRRILLFCAHDLDIAKSGQVAALSLPAAVVQLHYHWDQMFVALANGTVAIFKRATDGSWDITGPSNTIKLGDTPVVKLLPIGSVLYAACGKMVYVLDGITGETLVWTSTDNINESYRIWLDWFSVIVDVQMWKYLTI